MTRSAAGLRLLRAACLAALTLDAAHGFDPSPAEGEPPAEARAVHANRIHFHPLTSFYINGVNGAYERRFAQGRLGMHVPFYMGRIDIAGQGTESALGGGFGFDLFRSAAPSGGRISMTAEFIDLKRHDIAGYGYDFDPAFPVSSQSPYDIYHQYLYNAALTLGYRWEYPARRFLADLAFGAGYFGLRKPEIRPQPWVHRRRSLRLPIAYRGFLPVARFALGIPF